MNTLLQDLRYAIRTLGKSPGFTGAAALTLALGIGANTAIFSVVRDSVLCPRPYPDESQVVQLYTQDKRHPGSFRLFSYPGYTDVREQSAVGEAFSGVLAYSVVVVGVGEENASRRTFGAVLSANYFRTLQVQLARGRDFETGEERPGSAAAVVIASHLYWRKTGFDPQLVGSTIRVNERPYTVVGVTPERFSGTTVLFGPELYFPLGDYDLLTNPAQVDATRTLDRRDAYGLYVVGRLKPGVSVAAAGAVLQTVAAGLERTFPAEQKDQTLIIRPLPRLSISTGPVDERHQTLLGSMFLALAAMVLFVACLNLASMFLARGMARRKEVAVRLAVGGGRGRIIRQFLTEGFVLSLLGGAGGFLIGLASCDLLATSLAAHMPVAVFLGGGADPAVLVATLGFCALATVFFALGPAIRLTRSRGLFAELKEQAGEDSAPRRHRWLPRSGLVVAQIALSLGLLASAGLFVRGALKAGSIESGFRGDPILVDVDASLGGYDQARSLQLYRAACDRLAALPGVQAASIASTVPFGLLSINRPVQRAGASRDADSRPATAAAGLAFNVRWNSVGADYFVTMGLPLLRGRAFTKTEAELVNAPPVAVIDEALARRLWPEGDALGQRIQWAEPGAPTAAAGGGSGTMGASNDIARRAEDPQSVEVVGIVPATRWETFQSELGGQVFVPFAQGFQSNAFLQVRADAGGGADAATLERIRREVRAAAPGVPIFAVRTLRQHIDANAQLWLVRAGAAIVSILAALALALAVVGVYGVMAYAVARRTREIGIRLALGGEPRRVLRMVLNEGLIMTFGGAVPGFLLALGVGRLLSGMLYRVSPADPVALTVATAVLFATALFASWLPARRAARVDPMVALRCE